MFSAIIHALTTKNQRVLARRNYRFKINSKLQKGGLDPPSDLNSTSESGNEYVDCPEIEQNSRLTQLLYLSRHRANRDESVPIVDREPEL